MRAIARLRLRNQRLVGEHAADPEQVVRHLGAMQAQDYESALWGVAVRTTGASRAVVVAQIASGRIVRSWPMRGTLHFVPGEDVRWMLALTGARAMPKLEQRRARLAIEDATLRRAEKHTHRALEGGKQLSRGELLELLARANVPTDEQRGYHLLVQLAMRGLICFGPMRDKQATFALLEEWAPPQRSLTREESVALLVRRYAQSHGPATASDFAWWSGLTLREAQSALAQNEAPHDQPTSTVRSAHLLPGFDEYLLGYRDRSDVLDPAYQPQIVPGSNGVFAPILVYDGRVVGTWKRELTKRAVLVRFKPFTKLTTVARAALARAAERYGTYLGLPVQLAP